MPPPDGWRLGAGLYSPASNKTRAPAAGPRGSKMLLGQNEDATLEGLGTERRPQPEFGLSASSCQETRIQPKSGRGLKARSPATDSHRTLLRRYVSNKIIHN